MLIDVACVECGQPTKAMPGQVAALCTGCSRLRWDVQFRRGLAESRLRKAGLLNGEAAHMQLDTFVRELVYQRRAYEVVRGWLSDWAEHMRLEPYMGFKGSVLLWSVSSGTGKTHLARGVQRRVMLAGGVAVFCPMSELLNEIRASYDDRDMSTFTIMSRLRYSDLLILDDLGKEYVSVKARPWFRNILWDVIEHRSSRHKPLLVTSNLAPGELTELLGLYAASRLMEMVGDRVVDMTGPDWRMR